MENKASVTRLSDREIKQISGGAIPIVLVAFAKGFGGGVAAAAAVDVAVTAVGKFIE